MRTCVVLAGILASACGGAASGGSRLCNPPPDFASDGVVVTNAADLARIRGVSHLGGLLVCDVTDFTDLDLPVLEQVDTWVGVRFSPSIQTISMPRLRSASILSIMDLNALETIDLDALEEATDEFLAVGVSFAGLPRLERIELPNLARLGRGLALFQVGTRQLEVPALSTAPDVNVSLSALEALQLPSLVGHSSISVFQCPNLVSVVAPQVESLTRLELQDVPSMEAVELPRVQQLGPGVGAGLRLAWDRAQPSVDLSGLERVDGEINLAVEPPPLPKLQTVSSSVTVRALGASLEGLSALVQVGGDLVVVAGGALGISFPNLERVDGKVAVRYLDVEGLRFPSLLSAGGVELVAVSLTSTTTALDLSALAELDGSLLVQMTGLEALPLPSLRRVGRALVIEGQPSLGSVDAPQLTFVGGDFVIRDNPGLPSCAVDRLLVGLSAPPASIDTSNNGSGTCAP